MSDLRLRLVCPWANDGTGQWEVIEAYPTYSDVLGKQITLPYGFSSDLASVPKAPILFLLFGGRYALPSLFHDYLTRYRLCSREKADLVFLEFMRRQNDDEIKALRESGAYKEELEDRKNALEGRATAMYAAVALYTKTGLWKTDVDQPGYEPLG